MQQQIPVISRQASGPAGTQLTDQQRGKQDMEHWRENGKPFGRNPFARHNHTRLLHGVTLRTRHTRPGSTRRKRSMSVVAHAHDSHVAQAASKQLLEFKAGKLSMANNVVTAKPQPGVVIVRKARRDRV